MLKKPKKRNRKSTISRLMRRLIEQLYIGGLTTRQISDIVDYGKSTIHKVVYNISRDYSAAAKLRPLQPPKAERTSHQHARRIMEAHVGRKLLSNEHVHHKDENPFNNNIDNLEVKSASEHAKHHNPKNPLLRHMRHNRMKYMKNYLRTYRKVNRKVSHAEKT